MNEMNLTIQDKPVVYYVGVAKFWNWNDNPEEPVASLPYVIDHPKLGSGYNVSTSKILQQYFDGTIITLNTVYKPINIEEMKA